jgi:hypothetical protein
MSGYDRRDAAARRDEGVRTVTKYTWRAGVIGLICSAFIGLAFAHHADAQTAQQRQPGGILVPSQPPGPGHGGGQVTSGAT